MKRFWIGKAAKIIVLVALALTVFSTITMLLWNALMPVIFHLPLITFPQALGLLVLSKILFGGFRGGGPGGPRQHWKNKMKERWKNMPKDEREKFMQEWSNKRCGPFRFGGPGGPFGGPGGRFSEAEDFNNKETWNDKETSKDSAS